MSVLYAVVSVVAYLELYEVEELVVVCVLYAVVSIVACLGAYETEESVVVWRFGGWVVIVKVFSEGFSA